MVFLMKEAKVLILEPSRFVLSLMDDVILIILAKMITIKKTDTEKSQLI